MDWLSGIFVSSTHEALERQYNGRYGGNTASIRTYSSTSWASRPEIEDIDRAIAVSLAEEGKGKRTINGDSQLKEDEYLARALQESLKVGPPPRNRNVNQNGNVRQPMPFPSSTGFRICAGCNQAISHGRLLSCMGAVWHPECLRCHACNLPIAGYEIRTNAAGFIEYKTHPFWAQKYCLLHEHDGTPRCCSCERLEPRETRYAALNDGRKLCLECLDSAVMDTTECQPLYLDIQQFYEGLDMKLEQKIPILLVERQALNEAMDGERNGHYHMPETRGLCLSEEQTVSTVLRKPRFGIGNRVPSMRIEPYKLTGRCEVTAILILYGLPRLLTGSILAHEMMHAWLRLKGYRTLRQDVEEGICQVLAHMWLTSQIASISSGHVRRFPLEKKLAEFFKHQIESDQSPVYGNGFRAGNRAVLKYGLQKTLYNIRLTGNFPV